MSSEQPQGARLRSVSPEDKTLGFIHGFPRPSSLLVAEPTPVMLKETVRDLEVVEAEDACVAWAGAGRTRVEGQPGWSCTPGAGGALHSRRPQEGCP